MSNEISSLLSTLHHPVTKSLALSLKHYDMAEQNPDVAEDANGFDKHQNAFQALCQVVHKDCNITEEKDASLGDNITMTTIVDDLDAIFDFVEKENSAIPQSLAQIQDRFYKTYFDVLFERVGGLDHHASASHANNCGLFESRQYDKVNKSDDMDNNGDKL
ncbi:hypothetical protein [Facilibium subflavum]|uniref:hypothetical protein n=1 Tax=Facilibium subflavum TaxID=2219058 RepID=UPI000E65E4F4|nr:hypothetical protein [Facilibium subflavum]